MQRCIQAHSFWMRELHSSGQTKVQRPLTETSLLDELSAANRSEAELGEVNVPELQCICWPGSLLVQMGLLSLSFDLQVKEGYLQ